MNSLKINLARALSVKKPIKNESVSITDIFNRLKTEHVPETEILSQEAFHKLGKALRDDYKSSPMHAYATFKGSRHLAVDVKYNSAVWLDLDLPEQFDIILSLFESKELHDKLKGFSWVLHETTSSTPAHRKGRLLVFVKDYTPALVRKAILALSDYLGVNTDPATLDCSRCLFDPVKLLNVVRLCEKVEEPTLLEVEALIALQFPEMSEEEFTKFLSEAATESEAEAEAEDLWETDRKGNAIKMVCKDRRATVAAIEYAIHFLPTDTLTEGETYKILYKVALALRHQFPYKTAKRLARLYNARLRTNSYAADRVINYVPVKESTHKDPITIATLYWLVKNANPNFDRHGWWVRHIVYISEQDVYFSLETKKILTRSDINRLYGRYFMPVSTIKKEIYNGGNKWALNHIELARYVPEHFAVAYAPGYDDTFEFHNESLVNCYLSPTVKVKGYVKAFTDTKQCEADLQLWYYIASNMISSRAERELMLDFITTTVCEPQTKIKWALALISPVQQVAKSYNGKLTSAPLGDGAQMPSMSAFFSDFTGYFDNTKFVVVNEPPDNDKKAELLTNSLLSPLTESTIGVHKKGKDEFQVPNFINFMITTNNTNAIKLTNESERFLCVDVDMSHEKRDSLRANTINGFAAFEALIKSPARVLAMLMTRYATTNHGRCAQFNPNKVYKTELLTSLIESNLPEPVHKIVDLIEESIGLPGITEGMIVQSELNKLNDYGNKISKKIFEALGYVQTHSSATKTSYPLMDLRNVGGGVQIVWTKKTALGDPEFEKAVLKLFDTYKSNDDDVEFTDQDASPLL